MRSIGLWPAAALLAVAPPLSAAIGAPALAEPTRGAVAVVDSFHSALARGDMVSAAALLAEDAVIFESGGVERSKAEYAAHHLGADAEFEQSVSSSLTRRSGDSDGGLAWIASEGRITGTFKGKKLDLVTTETMLLRLGDKGWRIVHVHWSSAPKR